MSRRRETDATGELRTFGRRLGRKLSARQQGLMRELLPRVSLDLTSAAPRELSDLFGGTACEVWLEIGFGGGEQLIWQAERNPGVGFIGCEPFVGGIAKALTAIEARRLNNIRLYSDDARQVLRWLPDASISRAFVLFPDPWPKKRHRKRRFVARETLGMLARVMRCGAELRIATDIGDYARTILLAVRSLTDFRWLVSGATDWRTRPADWPATRYEEKAIREGRHCTYLRFIRVGQS
ncbi:MAG TPA: tRNA (guanine(46)-N(7))-methyltransferase TrmB [Hyphomicrobiaceae bacterium]|nr:tRNA (guanine(46)-N(7))-methyltransferase TrmB [Hyphomicrobiaceae bacterium]